MNPARLFPSFLFLAVLVMESSAARFTGQFEITVDSVYLGITNTGSYGFESGKVIAGISHVFGLAVGDTWTGYYTYESLERDGAFSSYPYDGMSALAITFGYPEYLTTVSHDEGPHPYLSVTDGHVVDAYFRYGWSGYLSHWGTIGMTTFNGVLYSSPSLPEQWNSLSGTVVWGDPVLIPEPASLSLLILFSFATLRRLLGRNR